jgi:hypothetical protein
MKKWRRSLRTADGRCCVRARCVITEHLADRCKSPVWPTEATYPLDSTVGVPEERPAALISDLRRSASPNPNRHKHKTKTCQDPVRLQKRAWLEAEG